MPAKQDNAARVNELWTQMDELVTKAEDENRGLKASEQRQFDRLESSIRELNGETGEGQSSDPIERHRDRDQVDSGQLIGGGDPRGPSGRGEVRFDEPLGESRMVDVARQAGQIPSEHEGLSLGRLVRGAWTGDWANADGERRALQEGSGSDGGYLVPTVLSSRLIDLARNQARVFQAGATTIPMSSSRVDVARWLSDPVASWKSEGATVGTSTPSLGKIELRAKSLAALVVASREVIEDTDVDAILENAFARRIALEFDRVALAGSGTDPEPQGLLNHPDVSSTALAATPSDYTPLISARSRLEAANETAGGAIVNPRLEATLAGLTASDGHLLQEPGYVSAVPRYPTNQVRTDGGANSNGSDVFIGDWSMLGMGVRTSAMIQPLRERYADTGEIGFLAWFRGDVAVLRPSAFDVTTDVRA